MCQWMLPASQALRVVASRLGFDLSRGRITVPKLKKPSCALRHLKHEFVAPTHSQGNGPLCGDGVKCSEVFLGLGGSPL